MKDDPSFALLMDGGDYEINGVTYAHEGLKKLLIELVWYNYNVNPFLISTKAGMKILNKGDAKTPTKQELVNNYSFILQSANLIWSVVNKYLIDVKFSGYVPTVQESGFKLIPRGGRLACSSGKIPSIGGKIDATLLQGQNGAFYLNRINHTGTQLSSTISDFDSSVSNSPALLNKVDKVTGKELSENDFTSVLKTKLDGIEAGANNYILPLNVAFKNSSNNFTQAQVLSPLDTSGSLPNTIKLSAIGIAGNRSTMNLTNSGGDIFVNLGASHGVGTVIKIGNTKNIFTNPIEVPSINTLTGVGTGFFKDNGTIDTNEYALEDDLNTKVDKVTGKTLSDNNLTDAQVIKLAQAIISASGSPITVTGTWAGTQSEFNAIVGGEVNGINYIITED